MRSALSAAALGLLLALVPRAQAKTSESFEARVVGITDGDTITVRVSNTPPYTIRLDGIDAPEKGQAFGDKSKKNLSNLVFQKLVRIEWKKKDGYGRIVGKVFVSPENCARTPCPATLDINLTQVSAGLAWHYKQYEKEQSQQDRHAYGNAEQNARRQKLGLWRDAHPVAPWNWRHVARPAKAAAQSR
jgi:endonuclease YncB( thermonuclease family)